MRTISNVAVATQKMQAALHAMYPRRALVSPLAIEQSLRAGGHGVISEAGATSYAAQNGMSLHVRAQQSFGTSMFASELLRLSETPPTPELDRLATCLERASTDEEITESCAALADFVTRDLAQIGIRVFYGGHGEGFALRDLSMLPRYPECLNYYVMHRASGSAPEMHLTSLGNDMSAGWLTSMLSATMADRLVHDRAMPIRTGWIAQLGRAVLLGCGRMVGGMTGLHSAIPRHHFYEELRGRLAFSFEEPSLYSVHGSPVDSAVRHVESAPAVVNLAAKLPRLSYALLREGGAVGMFVHFDRDCLERWAQAPERSRSILGVGDIVYDHGVLRINGDVKMLHSEMQLVSLMRGFFGRQYAFQWETHELP